MLSNENKTVPAIFREFLATIETLIEKTCIQEMTRENILPTSTVSPSNVNLDTIDFNTNKQQQPPVAKIAPIPYRDDIESQDYIIHIKPYQQQGTVEYTVEYCDMV